VQAIPGATELVGNTIANNLGGIAKAIATAPGTNVSGIVQALANIFTTLDTPIPLYNLLASEGYVDDEYLPYFGQGATAPAAVANAFVKDWKLLRDLAKHWLGVDIGPPGKTATAPAAGPNQLKAALNKFLNGADSVVLPVLQPLIATVVGQLAPAGATTLGTIGISPDKPVASAVSVALSAGVTAWLVSFLGIDAGEPLAHIAELMAAAIGFEELRDVQIAPLVNEGLAKVATMQARAKFQQELPSTSAMLGWVARGLMTSARAQQLSLYNGTPNEIFPIEVAAAYRGMNARQMLRLIETGLFSQATIQGELTYAGIRPSSQALMLQAAPYLATASQRSALIAEIQAAAVAGLLSDDDVRAQVASANSSSDQTGLILARVHLQQLVAETKALETEYTTLYKAGLLDDPTFRGNLAGIGLQPFMVNIVAAKAEASANATLQRKTIAAAAATARATASKERQDAMKAFTTGTIDAAALSVALVATGLTVTQAAAWVGLAELQLAGSLRWIYGLQLPPAQAILLRQRVTALTNQLKAAQITPAQMVSALTNLGLPVNEVNGIVAAASASATTSTPAAAYIQVKGSGLT
jgi:hypothetical protein